ncbi:MAG: aldehyde ferredoxin oxidoreductase C-terminal domain-containing protein, partial [Desulfobacterales bacterium]|nr:aldehyde ferredoxin oxidoreductase C-terminal domain-containing protein [Desulfobacterales bacterium]
LFDTFILCRFYRDFYPWEELATLLELTTGLKLDQGQLSELAGRVTDATRLFNLREGLTKAHDTLPDRMFRENLENDKGISRTDLDYLVQDYYKLRGWDEKGIPMVR